MKIIVQQKCSFQRMNVFQRGEGGGGKLCCFSGIFSLLPLVLNWVDMKSKYF